MLWPSTISASGAASRRRWSIFRSTGGSISGSPVVGVMLVLGSRETKLLALELAALFAVGIVLGEVLKFTTFRERPYETIDTIVRRLPIDLDSSYPSWTRADRLNRRSLHRDKVQEEACRLPLFVLEAAAVCLSRVYVGMHYPLDVVSGAFLGIAIVGGDCSSWRGILDASWRASHP